MHTRASEVLGIDQPVVQAGMSREYTSAPLVAAVSAAGGLGILGCLGRTSTEVVFEMRRIRAMTDRPFGVNFVLHRLDESAFAAALAERPPVVSLFRGDPTVATAAAHAAGARVVHQVTTVVEAEQALSAGVDALIAQGTEAGGHNGPTPLWALLPAVVAVAGDRPVLAAGGIVDGRGLAAALCLGAAGVVMGTRFLATLEAPVSALYKQRLLAAGPDATLASDIPDLLWGIPWPGVQVRALRSALLTRWLGREPALLAEREAVLAGIERARASGDAEEMILLAGTGVGRIDALAPAGALVRRVVAEAAATLRDQTGHAGG
ncbi:MAG: nitronate monooxygenase [Chloroflexi bacterium]|nr:nitronate monooxygenase [Chloroflexota bacterium]